MKKESVIKELEGCELDGVFGGSAWVYEQIVVNGEICDVYVYRQD